MSLPKRRKRVSPFFNLQLFSYKTIFQTAQCHTLPLKNKWMREFVCRTKNFPADDHFVNSHSFIPFPLIIYWDRWEKIDVGHSQDLTQAMMTASKKWKKTAFFTNSWTLKTSSFHFRGVLLQWRVIWGCSTLTYNPFNTLLYTISERKVNTWALFHTFYWQMVPLSHII